MATNANGEVDRVEAAGNITLLVSKGSDGGSDASMVEVPISRLDTTKEVEISEIRESSIKANGYSITSISYSGTMMFQGTKFSKDGPGDDSTAYIGDLLYDDHGIPVPVSVNIQHDLSDDHEMYQHVLVNSESYEVRNEETTETAFDWVAMDRKSDQPS